MRLVMMGPPGAGKGTQAIMLAGKLSVPHISTGDIFRDAIKNGTELGKKAKSYMEAGDLVPDDITVLIVRERLSNPDCKKGFILDGFPRTVPQAESLEEILGEMEMPLDAVVEIRVDSEELIKRLENRRSCPECGKIYHLIFKPPNNDNICDDCNVELVHRKDDTREVILNRIKVYHEKTDPLTGYYRKSSILKEVDGKQAINKVLESIIDTLKAVKSPPSRSAGL